MKISTTIPAIILALAPLAASFPTHTPSTHVSESSIETKEQDMSAKEQASNKPWLIFSMREQPFEEASLSFTFMDPTTHYTTDCKTSLPMSGYSFCADGKTSFVYGGVSFQYGETWLSVQRPDTLDCAGNTSTSSAQVPESNAECTKRAATGHLNLPNNFWQQPGWNSWVHPESLDVHWTWAA